MFPCVSLSLSLIFLIEVLSDRIDKECDMARGNSWRGGLALGLLAMLGIGGAGLSSAVGDEPSTLTDQILDPVSGEVADGTVKSLAAIPGVIEFAGEGAVTLLRIMPMDEPQTSALPRLVAFRSATVSGVALRLGEEVQEGETLDGGFFKNPGPFTLKIEFLTGNELRSVQLAPGFGLLVGTDISPLANSLVWGCRCTCTKSGTAEWEYSTLPCMPPDGSTTYPPDCQCELYNEQLCQFESGEDWGTTGGCERALIKAP